MRSKMISTDQNLSLMERYTFEIPHSLRPVYTSRLKTVIYDLVLLCVLLSTAFTGSLSAQRFETHLLDRDENFAGLDVSALAQDSRGHLWIATPSGVLAYDGARFRDFGREDGLTDPTVFSLLVDSSGTVWAGSHGGLFWFDGHQIHELFFHGESLHIGVNSMLAASKSGELVAQTPHQLYSILRTTPGGQWNVETYWSRHPAYKFNKDWNGIGFDAKGKLVMGCDQALCVLDGDRIRILGVEQGIAPDYYVSIFRSRNGVLWVRGRKHIAILRPGGNSANEIGNLLSPGALITIHRRFTEDAVGNILTPTAQGFATWDGEKWTETERTSEGALGGASEVFCDREGSIWIGTDGAGLFESRGYRVWANYGREQGFRSPNITAIQKDRAGTVWFGTAQGTMLLRKGASALSESALKGKQDTEGVVSLAPSPDGGMWVGTQLGSITHVTSSGSIDVTTSIDAYIHRIRLAKDGTLWIATNEGLFNLNCGARTTCTPTPYGGNGWVQSSVRDFVLSPDGTLWVVGEHGLIEIKNGHALTLTVVGMDHTSIHGRIDLLARDDDGSLWLARSNTDLLHVRVSADRAESVERYIKPQLPSVTFSFLERALDGSIWLGTDHGVAKISRGVVSLANYDDGLIWNSTGEGAFLADPDGTIWVGTTLGVSHLLRQSKAFMRSRFQAEVGASHYNDLPMQNDKSLKWTGGVTNIEFTGLTFHGNQSLVYYYRLLGFDDHVIRTNVPFVRFQKLPPGRYVFRVVAQDPVHNIFSEPAAFSFTLLPPWWRTWWFKCVATTAALVVLLGLWHLSHLAHLGQRSRLQRMVAERTSKLEYLVVRDGLTGLLNRNAILERLSTELNRAQTTGKSLCVSLIDLDHFKNINDTWGHLAGDTVLREAATRLQGAVRSTDFIGRYGGEEFIVILTEIEREPGIERCELMRQALCSQAVLHEGMQLAVTCSIGLAGWTGASDNLASLIARADRAMYGAKSNGRNRVEFAV